MINKKILILVSLLLVSFLLVGCWLFPPTEVAVTGVTLDKATLALTVGDAPVTLVATVEPEDATDPSIDWDSSDGTVATVTAGVVTPLTAGTADITVTTVDGNFPATCVVTVAAVVGDEPELIGIKVVPEEMTLFVRGSKPITSVTAQYDDGTTADIALGDCTHLSSDGDVAKVSDAGKVTAIGVGTATITVIYEGEIDTLKVTVNPIRLTSIVVDPKEMNLIYVGEPDAGTDTIDSITAYYNNGTKDEIELDDTGITYTSSSGGVVEIANGVVTAKAVGETTITVTYREEEQTKAIFIEETATIKVTVIAYELDHIEVLPEEMTLYFGEGSTTSEKFIESVTAYYNDGTDEVVKPDSYSSDDILVADVGSAGKVTAIGVGTTTISISYTENDITAEATIDVTVLALELTGIEVDPDEMTLYLGIDGYQSDTFTVKANYNDDTTIIGVRPECVYGISDTSIVTVDKSAGKVTAIGVGTTTISISYTENDITAEATIDVTVLALNT